MSKCDTSTPIINSDNPESSNPVIMFLDFLEYPQT